MSRGLVKFKLLWIPGGPASSLDNVYILLSFSYLDRNPSLLVPDGICTIPTFEPQLCGQDIGSPHNYTNTFLLCKTCVFALEMSGTFFCRLSMREKETDTTEENWKKSVRLKSESFCSFYLCLSPAIRHQ